MSIEEKWNEIDTKLGIVYSNLGICCKIIVMFHLTISNLEEVMEMLVDIRQGKDG